MFDAFFYPVTRSPTPPCLYPLLKVVSLWLLMEVLDGIVGKEQSEPEIVTKEWIHHSKTEPGKPLHYKFWHSNCLSVSLAWLKHIFLLFVCFGVACFGCFLKAEWNNCLYFEIVETPYRRLVLYYFRQLKVRYSDEFHKFCIIV